MRKEVSTIMLDHEAVKQEARFRARGNVGYGWGVKDSIYWMIVDEYIKNKP